MESHAPARPPNGDREPQPQPEPFAAAFRAAFHGTDVHKRVRAAAIRAAKNLAIEDRLAKKLPRE